MILRHSLQEEFAEMLQKRRILAVAVGLWLASCVVAHAQEAPTTDTPAALVPAPAITPERI